MIVYNRHVNLISACNNQLHYGCGDLVCGQEELVLVIMPVCASIHYPLMM